MKKQQAPVNIWSLIRSLARLESGVWCRRCGEAIVYADAFGRGEGVCGACRA
jgi:hypothetical protein